MNDIKSNLENLTINELKEICKELNISISDSSQNMIFELLKPLFSVKIYTGENVKDIANKLEILMKKCWETTSIIYLLSLRYTWYVIFDDQKLVAALGIDTDNIIWNLCVDPDYRKQGHASNLLTHVIKDTCKQYNLVSLHVQRYMNPNYSKLIKFYQKHGFKIMNGDLTSTKLTHFC